MENLELKHIAPYLPYGLHVKSKLGVIYELDTFSNSKGKGIEKRDIYSVVDNNMKPILRPLSDLSKEITHGGETFIPVEELGWNSYDHIIKNGECTSVSYEYTQKLL